MWTKNLEKLKSFKLDVLSSHFQGRGIVISEYSRGYKFFAEGYVQNVEIENNSGKVEFSVRARCHHSQKRNEKAHALSITFLEEDLKVKECHCSCLIGLSESCHHIIGLGYYLQDLILRGIILVPDDTTCTSKAMTWNKPRGSQIVPESVMSLSFVKTNKIVRKRKPVRYRHFVPKVTTEKKTADAHVSCKAAGRRDVIKMCMSLKEVCSNIPMSYVINLDHEEDSTLMLHERQVEIPLVSFAPNTLDTNLPIKLPKMDSMVINILISLPLPNNDAFVDFSFEKSEEIEMATRQQSQCQEWFQFRNRRFTASNFKSICRRRKFTNEFFKSMWEQKNIDHVRQIQHGKREELNAKHLYITKTGNKVYSCGLVIHPYAPHLGASPDGVVFDKNHGYGNLEIKCPCGKHPASLKDALQSKNFALKVNENNVPELRINHTYYYQVQGQMLITSLPWCDLVLFFKTSNELFIQRIDFDEEFCWEMYNQLTNIYNTHFLTL